MKHVDVYNRYYVLRNNVIVYNTPPYTDVRLLTLTSTKRFLLTSTYPFRVFMIAWHTSGMMVDIAGTDIRNIYI